MLCGILHELFVLSPIVWMEVDLNHDEVASRRYVKVEAYLVDGRLDPCYLPQFLQLFHREIANSYAPAHRGLSRMK